ncbi:MAG: NAD-dependent epimerase/dehydratase family protein [Eubacteriales bacterium]|nr:NAD-dependent epimerase/dehydratase family protein [Eubacteriales bacterium]
MNILITGASGFVGKNLSLALLEIKKHNDRTHPSLLEKIDNIFLYNKNSTNEELEEYCKSCDFVFHLAGVNRPKNDEEFNEGNVDFTNKLLSILKKYKNNCPIMLSSSIQAKLDGVHSEYGKSKLKAEESLLSYEKETKANIYIYRFHNIFGKWCKPNYNSCIATWCYNIARDLQVEVSARNNKISLIYIDDVIEEMINLLEKNVDKNNNVYEKSHIYYISKVYEKTLGEIIDLIYIYANQAKNLFLPKIPIGSFETKLYSTYLSYLPKEKIRVPLLMKENEKGSFTELMKTNDHGQFSVNVSLPNMKKGEHFHNSKWEYFIVVSGRALIKERKMGLDENGKKYPIIEFEVSSDKIEAIHMLPGYSHAIINLSNTEKLVTIMWSNEVFNPMKPDTFNEDV